MRNCSLSGGWKRGYKSISCQGRHAILVLFGRIELQAYLSFPFLSFETLVLQPDLTSSQGIVEDQLSFCISFLFWYKRIKERRNTKDS